MFERSLLPFARRHLPWLLCLALLLPLAQLAGTAHALSHLPGTSEAADHDDPKSATLHHCPLCPLASVVAGGALPSAAPALALPMQSTAAPAARDSVAPAVAPPVFFRSRAPPLA